ncbi:unnamed protein product [Amoebophrya sp. A120]|nr:unnamed protein product [Amoebophrya sp. A120]|eukprot:GSA120T00001363001.1
MLFRSSHLHAAALATMSLLDLLREQNFIVHAARVSPSVERGAPAARSSGPGPGGGASSSQRPLARSSTSGASTQSKWNKVPLDQHVAKSTRPEIFKCTMCEVLGNDDRPAMHAPYATCKANCGPTGGNKCGCHYCSSCYANMCIPGFVGGNCLIKSTSDVEALAREGKLTEEEDVHFMQADDHHFTSPKRNCCRCQADLGEKNADQEALFLEALNRGVGLMTLPQRQALKKLKSGMHQNLVAWTMAMYWYVTVLVPFARKHKLQNPSEICNHLAEATGFSLSSPSSGGASGSSSGSAGTSSGQQKSVVNIKPGVKAKGKLLLHNKMKEQHLEEKSTVNLTTPSAREAQEELQLTQENFAQLVGRDCNAMLHFFANTFDRGFQAEFSSRLAESSAAPMMGLVQGELGEEDHHDEDVELDEASSKHQSSEKIMGHRPSASSGSTTGTHQTHEDAARPGTGTTTLSLSTSATSPSGTSDYFGQGVVVPGSPIAGTVSGAASPTALSSPAADQHAGTAYQLQSEEEWPPLRRPPVPAAAPRDSSSEVDPSSPKSPKQRGPLLNKSAAVTSTIAKVVSKVCCNAEKNKSPVTQLQATTSPRSPSGSSDAGAMVPPPPPPMKMKGSSNMLTSIVPGTSGAAKSTKAAPAGIASSSAHNTTTAAAAVSKAKSAAAAARAGGQLLPKKAVRRQFSSSTPLAQGSPATPDDYQQGFEQSMRGAISVWKLALENLEAKGLTPVYALPKTSTELCGSSTTSKFEPVRAVLESEEMDSVIPLLDQWDRELYDRALPLGKSEYYKSIHSPQAEESRREDALVALSFAADDEDLSAFMSPAEIEAQRRMLEMYKHGSSSASGGAEPRRGGGGSTTASSAARDRSMEAEDRDHRAGWRGGGDYYDPREDQDYGGPYYNYDDEEEEYYRRRRGYNDQGGHDDHEQGHDYDDYYRQRGGYDQGYDHRQDDFYGRGYGPRDSSAGARGGYDHQDYDDGQYHREWDRIEDEQYHADQERGWWDRDQGWSGYYDHHQGEDDRQRHRGWTSSATTDYADHTQGLEHQDQHHDGPRRIARRDSAHERFGAEGRDERERASTATQHPPLASGSAGSSYRPAPAWTSEREVGRGSHDEPVEPRTEDTDGVAHGEQQASGAWRAWRGWTQAGGGQESAHDGGWTGYDYGRSQAGYEYDYQEHHHAQYDHLDRAHNHPVVSDSSRMQSGAPASGAAGREQLPRTSAANTAWGRAWPTSGTSSVAHQAPISQDGRMATTSEAHSRGQPTSAARTEQAVPFASTGASTSSTSAASTSAAKRVWRSIPGAPTATTSASSSSMTRGGGGAQIQGGAAGGAAAAAQRDFVQQTTGASGAGPSSQFDRGQFGETAPLFANRGPGLETLFTAATMSRMGNIQHLSSTAPAPEPPGPAAQEQEIVAALLEDDPRSMRYRDEILSAWPGILETVGAAGQGPPGRAAASSRQTAIMPGIAARMSELGVSSVPPPTKAPPRNVHFGGTATPRGPSQVVADGVSSNGAPRTAVQNAAAPTSSSGMTTTSAGAFSRMLAPPPAPAVAASNLAPPQMRPGGAAAPTAAGSHQHQHISDHYRRAPGAQERGTVAARHIAARRPPAPTRLQPGGSGTAATTNANPAGTSIRPGSTTNDHVPVVQGRRAQM